MKPHRATACSTLAAATLLALLGACAQPPLARAPFTVKLIAFNDYHGHLQSPGTFGANALVQAAQRPAVGGADMLAGYVAALKARNPLNVVVGAGDFIGASPLISSLFFDEPSVETLNRIGVEFTAVGNHEFDRGAAELKRLAGGGCKRAAGGAAEPNSCKGLGSAAPGRYDGATFEWLAANVVEADTGRTLFAPYGVKSFNGVRIAFIGMTLAGTPTIVTPTGVAGLAFRDEADTVNALVPVLRRQGIEAIVVLLHEGGVQGAGLADLNGCDGNLAGSALEGIVARLDDAVDLVVSGHTHAAYNCSATTVDVAANPATGSTTVTRTPRPTGLRNAAGRRVPVTSASAFGRVLSDIDLTLDPASRDITAVRPDNLLVDRGNPAVAASAEVVAEVAAVVAGYNALVTPIANQVVGSISAALPTTAADAACNLAVGELVADAQLAATAPAGFGDAVIAFTNRGGVRSPGLTFASSAAGEGDGHVTYGEAFTAQPFGNSLVTMTLTAQDIKDVLEQQFAGCRGQSATATRLLLPSAGLRYTWDGAQACNARVRSVTLTRNGVAEVLVDAAGNVSEPQRIYRVTVNSFLAAGGDGFSTFTRGTALLGGAQDIDALVALLGAHRAPRPPYDPAAAGLGKPRIGRIGGTACPTGAEPNT